MLKVFACGSWKGTPIKQELSFAKEDATSGEQLAFVSIEALMKLLEPDTVTIHPPLTDSVWGGDRQTITRESPTQMAKRLGFDELKLNVGKVEQTVL